MNRKTVTMLVMAGLLGFVIASGLHPNHDPHFPWDSIPGFYCMFGVAAGLALIGIALGLGNFFLWRPTWSVQLTESMVAKGVETVTLKAWRVVLNETVRKGDPLLVFGTEKGDVTISAPVDGMVQKMFYFPNDTVDVGWTLVDLKVSRHVMHHGIGGGK